MPGATHLAADPAPFSRQLGVVRPGSTGDRGGEWVTIERTVSSAAYGASHELARHSPMSHQHEYTSMQEKRDPTVQPFTTVNQGMAAAMTRAAEDWPAILENWRSR